MTGLVAAVTVMAVTLIADAVADVDWPLWPLALVAFFAGFSSQFLLSRR